MGWWGPRHRLLGYSFPIPFNSILARQSFTGDVIFMFLCLLHHSTLLYSSIQQENHPFLYSRTIYGNFYSITFDLDCASGWIMSLTNTKHELWISRSDPPFFSSQFPIFCALTDSKEKLFYGGNGTSRHIDFSHSLHIIMLRLWLHCHRKYIPSGFLSRSTIFH